MQQTADYIKSFGPWAMFFSFCLVLVVNAIGFPPAIIFSAANALIFGIVPGIILSWLAETVGVTLSFLLMRFLFRDAAEGVIAKHASLKKIDSFSGKNGFKVMLIARTVPYFPSGILNALGAVSQISLFDYVLSSLIGKFPSTALEAMIGHDAMTMAELADAAMLFIRCRGGISHNPAESVRADDVDTAARVLLRLLETLSFPETP